MNEFYEKFLYHIWDQQHLNPELSSAKGLKLKIKFPGHWNKGKGPDFKNAIIEIDGKDCQGDVEIHHTTYDWIAHGHHEDSNYNKVILHVVYENKMSYPYTIKENSEKVEILELRDVLSEEITKLLEEYPDDSFSEKEKYCKIFSIQSEWIPKILNSYGLERIERKISRYQAELSFCTFDQLLYQGIFESLGYSNNKYAFYQLAHLVPYTRIHQMIEHGYTKMDILSLWIHSSDLISFMPTSINEDFINKINESFIKMDYSLPDLTIEWNLFRIRPINNPVMRLIQVLDFIYECASSSFTNHLLKLFSVSKENLSVNEFRKRAQLYMSRQSFTDIDTHIGAGRLDLILVNVVIPIVCLYARKMEYKDLEEYCMYLLKEYPGVAENSITKSMKKYLTDDIELQINKKAIMQQGLIHIYQNYCLNHICESCEHDLQEAKSMISRETDDK